MADKEAEAAEGPRANDLNPQWQQIVAALGIVLGLFHLYTAATFVLAPMVQRAVHLSFILALLFICYPATKSGRGDRPSVLSLVIGALGIASCVYVLREWQEMTERTTDPTWFDLGFGIAVILAVLEGARRTLGPELTVVSVVFIAYAFFGDVLPDPLGHPGMDVDRFMAIMYLSDQGIFGVPLGVSATYVFLFVVFAELLVALGGAKFFIEIAHSLLGTFRGGPAKVAVVSSALMGTVSGSAVANVVTVGSVTIPMMKATGYSARFAAAVEAVASTGGQIMPPIMSTAAFVMAEMLGTAYSNIIIAAAIPAVLYFLSVFVAVDLEAAQRGIRGLSPSELPSAVGAFRSHGHVLLPLGVLIYLLVVEERSPMMSVFWSIVVMLGTDVIKSLLLRRKIQWRGYFGALARAAVTSIPVVAACAAGGIIIGVVSGTGLGLTFSSAVIDVAGGNMTVLLILTMVASLILGTGLSTVASYIVLAVLAAPALIAGGIHPIAAHLFVLYFGVISVITPPVALASYVAASIAQADPVKVGWMSTRLGIVAFLIPFNFVVNPALLMMGSPLSIALGFAGAILSTISLVMGVQGYALAKCGVALRAVLIAAAILLMFPLLPIALIGGCIFAASLGTQWLLQQRAGRRA